MNRPLNGSIGIPQKSNSASNLSGGGGSRRHGNGLKGSGVFLAQASRNTDVKEWIDDQSRQPPPHMPLFDSQNTTTIDLTSNMSTEVTPAPVVQSSASGPLPSMSSSSLPVSPPTFHRRDMLLSSTNSLNNNNNGGVIHSPSIGRLLSARPMTPPRSPTLVNALSVYRAASEISSNTDEMLRMMCQSHFAEPTCEEFLLARYRLNVYKSDGSGGLDNDTRRYPRTEEIPRLSTYNEIFGMSAIAAMFRDNIVLPRQSPSFFTYQSMRPSHFMCATGVHGIGIRTFVCNFAREQNINCIVLAPLCSTADFVEGTYRALVQLAWNLRPCIVLLDRLEEHWTTAGFPSSGLELFGAWQMLCAKENIPDIWFVISTLPEYSIAKKHPDLLVHYIRHCTASTVGLAPEEMVIVMRAAFATWIRVIGVIDDRPALPAPHLPAPSTQDSRRLSEELANSHFHRILERYNELISQFVQRVVKSQNALSGHQIHNFVSYMFQAAYRRFQTQPALMERYLLSMQLEEAARNNEYLLTRLPNHEDFEDAMKNNLPFKC